MIQHSVIFSFKNEIDPTEKAAFFEAAWKLATIPGVQNFDILAQTSPKNSFDYGIVMAFETAELFENYVDHPEHVYFVQQVWLKSVERFLEIDYQPLS